jgi:biotin carboxylase
VAVAAQPAAVAPDQAITPQLLIKNHRQSPAKPGITPGFVILVAPSGSYRIAAYTSAARALGMPIMVVSNSEHSLVPDIANGINVDFGQPELALEIILDSVAGKDVACVLATDDSCVELCSRVASSLDLPHNSPDAALLTQRKDLGREALAQAGCNTPSFQRLELAGLDASKLDLPYPVVIKPLALAASRGVIRADNDDEFDAACRRIDAILESTGLVGFTRQHLLVESYIDGQEYAVEGFMVDGEFRLLTVFDKPEPLTGPFFEETYYLTPTRLDRLQQIKLVEEIAKCCQAYGLEQGPVHAEARLSASGPVLLELASRTIGGQCGQLIEFSLQQKLEELVIQGMCGVIPDNTERVDAAGVLMIPITQAGILKRVEGLTEAMQTEYVRDIEIHINPGYELVPLPEGASYLGFIFAQAPDFERTYKALKSAYQKLRFVTQPKWVLESL